MFCNKCGNELKNEALFCPQCGNNCALNDTPSKEKKVPNKSNKVLIVTLIIISVISVLLATYILLDHFEVIKPKDERVELAISKLKEEWHDIYNEDEKYVDRYDGYLEITRTHIIEISPTKNEEFIKHTTELLETNKQVKYIVEFEIMTDYYGSAPYYENVGINDCVVIYDDGTAEAVERNPILHYRYRTYKSDYSDIIVDIIDYGSKFNETFYVK